MKLYFLYARVSDDRYLESLETQIGLLKDMADAPNNGYRYDGSTIICEHDSGSSGGRPEFSKMIEALTEDSKKPPKDRQYAGVIFFKIDRLFRNFQDFNQVERLMGLGYRFVSITETIENTPTGRLLFRMLAGFAIYESDKLSNRQSFSNLTNSLKGNFERLGSRLVTGYEIRKVGTERCVRINQAEAALIRFIYDLKIQNPASSVSVLTGLVLDSQYAGVLTGIIQAAIDRRVSSKLK
ncbi:MAG TPA: recombinase family protein [bacterium]|nr:recombinase family protein [bacterium]